MVFDYKKRNWTLSSPQQEAIQFEDNSIDESLLRLETVEFALKYIKENLL